MDKLKAYEEILVIFNKHKDLLEEDYDLDRRSVLSERIARCKMEEVLGFSLKDFQGDIRGGWLTYGHNGCHSNMKLTIMGEIHGRTVSWPDDHRQPTDEWLFSLCFSTGAYIFHKDYPTKTFKNFFDELKTLKPKYSDTRNKELYFELSQAKEVWDKYPSIRKKYTEIAQEEIKQRNIAQLEKQLSDLKN